VVLKEKYGEEDPLASEWEEAAKSIIVPKVEEEPEKTEEVAKGKHPTTSSISALV